MRNHNKRWLISRLKTAGSRRDHLINGSYAEERHSKRNVLSDDMPFRESISKTREFYNGKINHNLIGRFLRGQVGKNWDEIFQEITNRIPKRLLEYENMVFWYVADHVQFIDNDLFHLREQKFIVKDGQIAWLTTTLEFYVDPEDKKLKYISELVK